MYTIMESLMIRRAVVLVLVVHTVVFQASTQICLGKRILSTVGGESPTQEDASLVSSAMPAAEVHETPTSQQVSKSYWIHRDHPDSRASSPSYNTSSHSERFAAALRRSLMRADSFSRRVLTASSGNFYSPLTRDIGDYEYNTVVSVGTPPKQFIVIIDTGSDLVWLNCQPCIECITFPPDPPFDPTQSSSYRNALCSDTACTGFPYNQSFCSGQGSCEYFYQYADLTFTSGVVAYETFSFTNLNGSSIPIPHIIFGCGLNESYDSFTGSDGLVGLGQGTLSLPSQLSSIFRDVFSYCLVPFNSSNIKSSTFYFGIPETNISIYTPIILNPYAPTVYYVNMTGISVAGVLVGIVPSTFDIVDGYGGIIFDSGTSLTLLTDVAYTIVSEAFQTAFTYPTVYTLTNQLCFDLTKAPANFSVPSIVFHFQDVSGVTVDFVLARENILQEVMFPIYCFTIILSPLDLSIIGNIAQADHQMVFDRVNSKIGWASQTC